MFKLQLLAIIVVVFLGQALGAAAQGNTTAPAAAPVAAPYPAPAPPQAPAPAPNSAPAAAPAPAPAPYSAQPPAQYQSPAQAPAPYPGQAPAQYPAPAPAQYPAPGPAPLPPQAPAPYPGQAPAPSVAPNPSLESPYGRQPLVAYPAPAPFVQRRELPPGYRTHDGFYLRMLVGGAVGGTTYTDSLGLRDDGSRAHTRTLGSAVASDLAIGWAVAENLIVHANLNFTHVDEVKKIGDRDWSKDELTTLMGFFGGGVTYYFMPVNIYISGSIGVGGLSQTSGDDHEQHESNTGFGTSVALGKEWWLGRTGQWAIGVALTGSYYQAPLELDGIKSTYRGHSTGVAFSTTFN